ncbi:MAG: NigD-like protein [Dysgonomonas sp.]
MKRYIQSLSILMISALLALGFVSCGDDDGYSLDKYWRSIATINKVGDNTYDFTLDSGEKLWVAAPVGLNLDPKNKRAIINYTILSDAQNGYDHYIKLNGFSEVLTKDIIYIAPDDKIKQDSIGHSPIKVYSVWEGGDYLNISFGFNVGGIGGHMINLVSAESDLSKDENIVKLEFRHNQKNDPEHYPSKSYVSFNLAPYKIEGRDEVTIELMWKDFDGETKTYKIEYKYNKTSDAEVKTYEEFDTNLNIY